MLVHSLTGIDQLNGLKLYGVRLTQRYKWSRFAKIIEFFRSKQTYIESPKDNLGIAHKHVEENIRIF